MNKLNNKGIAHLGLILGAVIVLLIIVIGWLVYDRNQDDEPTAENQESSAAVQEEDDASENEDVVTERVVPDGYVEYSNSDFSFNIPEGWEDKTDENPEIAAFFTPEGQDFPTLYVTESLQECTNPGTGEIKDVMVDGIDAQQYTVSTSAISLTTCFESEDKVYHIIHGYTTESFVDEYNELVDSFKFL